jgi:hypothetical protein
MGRIVQPQATRGSQRWLQELVAANPQRLDSAIGLGTLEWLSPLPEDEWAEYRDEAFLDRLGVELTRQPLSSFWPTGGPVWDGLARTPWGASVLIEAKAHVTEMASSCQAESSASLATIGAAFEATKAAFDVDPEVDWCTGYYQYANRLAHAYLMNELNGVPTELVFLHFVGDSDVDGPASREEWQKAIITVHDALGVLGQLPRYVRDAFVDVGAG